MKAIGLLGVGHLGKIHARLLKESPFFDLVGFVDPNDKVATKVSSEMGLRRFGSLSALLESVDAVDIVTPTFAHFDCAQEALKAGKHVFIEKPAAEHLTDLEQLIRLRDQHSCCVQVGHVERFNPAWLAVKDRKVSPLFIETHRLAQFNPRGTDVSVVLDLMIHDLDIILSMVQSEVKEVRASGVSLIAKQPDICNARIEFENGCVANVTASRLSMKNMRKTRIFQKDAYISLDFLEKKTEIIRMSDEEDPNVNSLAINTGAQFPPRFVSFEQPECPPVNAIALELEAFSDSIDEGTEAAVTLEDAYRAIDLAHRIMAEAEKGNLNV